MIPQRKVICVLFQSEYVYIVYKSDFKTLSDFRYGLQCLYMCAYLSLFIYLCLRTYSLLCIRFDKNLILFCFLVYLHIGVCL